MIIEGNCAEKNDQEDSDLEERPYIRHGSSLLNNLEL